MSIRSEEVPRVDIRLELSYLSVSDSVEASAALINTENVLSSYVIPKEVLDETPGVMKRTVYLMQYMPGVVGVVGHVGCHIAGQAQIFFFKQKTAYEVFEGNKFEGHTMLPVIDSFKTKYNLKQLIVVAD